ncbi:LacI family DNA-binding transcriptional regulator [soil metagenome]
MGRITLQDVASLVGVARSTVSRVLSNKADEVGISAELAQKIQAKARELNYIPNTSARAIRMGRFNCATLIMSTDSGRSYLPSRLLDGIHDALAASDLHLTVAKVPDEKLNSEDYVPKILRTLMSDGLLINYTHHLPEHLVEIVEQRQLPAVWINSRQPHDSVYPNNRRGGKLATERLLKLGHKRIAYVDFCHGRTTMADAHFSTVDRLSGYHDAMRDAGLEAWELRPEHSCTNVDEERAFAMELMRSPNRPTAIVCYFSIFVPAILWAASKTGVRIPEDLSLITFAAEDFRDQGLAVSAYAEPHYQLGLEAVDALRAKILSPRANLNSRELDFIWKDMGTCVAREG